MKRQGLTMKAIPGEIWNQKNQSSMGGAVMTAKNLIALRHKTKIFGLIVRESVTRNLIKCYLFRKRKFEKLRRLLGRCREHRTKSSGARIF